MMKKALVLLSMLSVLLINATPMSGLNWKIKKGDRQTDVFTASISFADLGFRDSELEGPLEAKNILFSTPPNWELVGGEIELQYDLFLTGSGLTQAGGVSPVGGGSLLLTLNNQVLQTVPLNESGTHSVRIPLSPQLLAAPLLDDGRHLLRITFVAEFTCQYDIRASVVIKNTSMVGVNYSPSSPTVDLSRLPAPFHLYNSFLPSRTLVVVPDAPSAIELQSALNVMAGLGSLIGSESNFFLTSESALTNSDLSSNNLIFVGLPEHFGLLANIPFPLPVNEQGKFSSLSTEAANDGILQMAVSPWGGANIILLISGASEAGVIKSSQAVSGGKILVYDNPALAYIRDVQVLADSIPVVESSTFRSLGYETQTLSGVGSDSTDFLFYVAKDQVTTSDAHLDLVYYHSGLLDYGFTSFEIQLNGQLINSTAFSKETEQVSTLRIKFPSGLLRYGENHLTVSTNLLPDNSCDLSGLADPWMVISDQSNFYIPSAGSVNLSKNWVLDLKAYPVQFVGQSDLGDVAFVLPKSSPSSWSIAGRMAYQLGQTANPAIPGLKVAFGDDVSPEISQNHSLIVIGRASSLPFLTTFNESLPGPFDFSNDTANERQLQVVYRVPPDVSLGYLELLYSPFDAERTVLVVSGNNDQGLNLAGAVIDSQSELHSQLAGIFAVTNGKDVAVGNNKTLFSVVGTLVPNSAAEITTPISPALDSEDDLQRPIWLLPFLIVSGLTVFLIIIFVVRSVLLSNQLQRPDVETADDAEEDKTKPR
jgi:cellulose synthase operon protein B